MKHNSLMLNLPQYRLTDERTGTVMVKIYLTNPRVADNLDAVPEAGGALVLLPLDRRFLLALVKSFYDGRGQLPGSIMVLCGLVADADTWEAFQRDWISAVAPQARNCPLSITDCLAGEDDFKGIAKSERMNIIRDAVSLIQEWTHSEKITAYACAVMLDDYARFEREHGGIIGPEAICVDDIIPRIDYQFRCPDVRFEYYFDINEKFKGQVERYWHAKESRRRRVPYYLRRVPLISPAPDEYVAVQAADAYVWSVYTYCRRFWCKEQTAYVPKELEPLISVVPPINARYDYDTMTSDPSRFKRRVLASMSAVPA